MSNLNFENKKVISIKKINDIVEQKNETHRYVNEEDDMTLKIKIDQLKHEIKNLEKQKETLLIDIKNAIDLEKEKWQEQKAAEKKEAQDVGYKVGYDAGYEDVFKQYETLLLEANEMTKLAKQDYDKTISKYEHAIIELAISVAEKIITVEIDERPEQFKQIVQKAVQDLKDSSNVEIYVHPNNYKLIMSQKEELAQMVRNEDVISVYIDQNLDIQGCIIKHPYGQIDVSVDTQLKQIKHVLDEKIAER